MIKIPHENVFLRAHAVADTIKYDFKGHDCIKAFAIPRGGIPAAYAVASFFDMDGPQFQLVDSTDKADAFIDDLIDSGATEKQLKTLYPKVPFYALLDKHYEFSNEWIVWPWENSMENSIEGNIQRLLQFIGEKQDREGLLETPKRVAKAWAEWCRGYKQDPKDILKCFEDGAADVDEMVVVKGIPVYSHCEHHMAAIFGTATVAYIPEGRIVGLSKIPRLVDIFARRLQVQERLTNQIANALEEYLHPKGVGVVIKARHLCMESRGVCQQGHHTITSALRGVMRTIPAARAEFLNLAHE